MKLGFGRAGYGFGCDFHCVQFGLEGNFAGSGFGCPVKLKLCLRSDCAGYGLGCYSAKLKLGLGKFGSGLGCDFHCAKPVSVQLGLGRDCAGLGCHFLR